MVGKEGTGAAGKQGEKSSSLHSQLTALTTATDMGERNEMAIPQKRCAKRLWCEGQVHDSKDSLTSSIVLKK
jgi:hypothetical protein